MVKKQQKKKVVAKKVTVAKKIEKKRPKAKKTIKKTAQKKAPLKKTPVKKQSLKAAMKKSVKKYEKKPVAKPLKKQIKKSVAEVQKKQKIKAEKKPNTIYSANQIQTFQKAKKDLQNKSNKQLADMLSANNQTKSGTKDNLIERVADGMTLGQIPRCPDCFGGRLRFNRINGEYTCPGYQDDDKFRFCNKKFNFTAIVRSPWVNADS